MPPRKAPPSADARGKGRKRRRNGSSPLNDHSDDSDSAAAAAAANDENNDVDDALHSAGGGGGGNGTLDGGGGGDDDRVLGLGEAEVRPAPVMLVSAFPRAARRVVNRPHPSVLAVMAAESGGAGAGAAGTAPVPALENISHGQLQVLPFMLPDHPSLSDDPDKPSTYVCTPPELMGGRGVSKQFFGKSLIVPKHAEWFSPTTVHRLEKQVLPHFFSGKSPGNTPEKYMMLRNRVIEKYLEQPAKRLRNSQYQGFVINAADLYDLRRLVKFLDSWGIINYLADGSMQRDVRLPASLITEEPTGELHLSSAMLKSIDGLILFDRPKCSVRAEDIASVASTSSSPDVANGGTDLDENILLKRLSESSCSICTQPLPSLHYESQKEAGIALCLDCFHDAKFITGHSSLDFQRVDGKKDGPDNDGNNWTDQEILLLLEGIDKYKENWNAVAEYVGTKSKVQCVQHFLRLPVEDGLLDNIKVPEESISSKVQNNGVLHSNSSGSTSGSFPQRSEAEHFPFIHTANPVMSLVAFLASAAGPRLAASCASAALSFLTQADSSSKGNDVAGLYAGPNSDSSFAIHSEIVRQAAMCGLAEAAPRCKLFADQEEREIQRLTATIINHQLKRLELKLKQFADIENMLLRESEQAERMRQGLQAQRNRIMSGVRLASPTGNAMASNPLSQANPQMQQQRQAFLEQQQSQMVSNDMLVHPQMQQQRQALLEQQQRQALLEQQQRQALLEQQHRQMASDMQLHPQMQQQRQALLEQQQRQALLEQQQRQVFLQQQQQQLHHHHQQQLQHQQQQLQLLLQQQQQQQQDHHQQQQLQMLSFGHRLPLSAINPSTSSGPNVMYTDMPGPSNLRPSGSN